MAPLVPLAGWVVKANCAAAAGLTAIAVEVVEVRLALVKLIVIFVATLCERLVNVARPPTVLAVRVPCRVPLPALRAAVTTSPLVETRLPAESSARITGCCANATPAVAVEEG